MIPLRDDERLPGVPWAGLLLFAAIVGVFALESSPALTGGAALVADYALVPSELSASATAWPTLLTSAFLHAGWAHVLTNLLYLGVFAPGLEARIGPLRLLAVYATSAVAGGLAHALNDTASTIPLVGASGAISGLLGATLVLRPTARIRAAVVAVFVPVGVVRVPAIFLIAVWFLLQLASGLGPVGPAAVGGVAWFAHIGGFAAGVAGGALTRFAEARRWTKSGGWG